MEKLELIPIIDASDFSTGVEDELASYDISTHYQSDIINLSWSGDSSYPKFKKYLVDTYGEDIKQYESFAILAT